MKNFLLFVVILSLISVAFAQFTLGTLNPERAASRIKSARICMRENGVKLDIVRKFRKGDFSSDDDKSKCFLKCFATNIGLLDKEGNVEMNYIQNTLEEIVKDEDKIEGIISKCAPVEDEDPNTCEFAFSAYQCFWNESKASAKGFEATKNADNLLSLEEIDELLDLEEDEDVTEVYTESTVTVSQIQVQTENPIKRRNRIKAARLCIKETGTTWNTVLKFKKGDFTNDDKISKCFMKCYAKKIGLFDADGKVNYGFIKNYLDDLVEPSKIEKIITKCSYSESGVYDSCEFAFDAYLCFWTEGGLNPVTNMMAKSTIDQSIFDELDINEIEDGIKTETEIEDSSRVEVL